MTVTRPDLIEAAARRHYEDAKSSHRELAAVMFAEAEPLMRERRRLRARMRVLQEQLDQREQADENFDRYRSPERMEVDRLDRRNDELSDNLSDLFVAAIGHALLAISEGAGRG